MNFTLYAEAYSPGRTLLAGLATFAGCLGLGLVVLRVLRLRIPAPFKQIVSVLLGIEIASLAVQLVAMAQGASRPALIGIWCGLVTVGPAAILLWPREQMPSHPRPLRSVLAVVIAASTVNLIAALAPSTKIDELHYHMLLPSRIVADGGLLFYRAPIEAAILPQMIYQLLASPLHALGLPDAPNILSWALSVMLVWLGWVLLRSRQPTSDLGYWSLAAIPVGMYPVVHDVTGGAHAFGDLATATAVTALGTSEQFLSSATPPALAATLSILCSAAAASKLSLWPLAILVLLLGAIVSLRAAKDRHAGFRIAAGIALPWLIFLLPLVAWTLAQTGSPFGPILAGHFGDSIYDLPDVQELIRETQTVERGPLGRVVFESLINYSPLIWLGVLGLTVSPFAPRPVRLWAAVLMVGQLGIIYILLPYQLRFLGGLHYGLLLLFGIYAADRFAAFLPPRVSAGAILVLIVPWLALQAWYGSQFVNVVVGREQSDAFYERHVSFFRDYQQLDRLLPSDAVLFVPDFRAPAVYAPRPMVFDPADIPADRPVFLFSGSPAQPYNLPRGYVAVRQVYFDAVARLNAFRTPGRQPEIGPLYVTLLERQRRDQPGPAGVRIPAGIH